MHARSHWARTVESIYRGNIVNRTWLNPFTKILHSRGLQLKHSNGASFRNHLVNTLVVIINILDIKIRIKIPLNEFRSIRNHRQCFKSQEVKFNETDFFGEVFIKLNNLLTFCSSKKRTIGHKRFVRDDH